MPTAPDNLVVDGDPAFGRVDTRTPAHLLPVGVAADAINKRFDFGVAGPRFNVAQGPWGSVPPGDYFECGFARFNDPQGLDVLVLATDEWRSAPGEDGGRGRVWKILANNAPVEVKLNGQDVYGTVRFVPCFNALVLLRQDLERHYFSAAAVGQPAANQIQLNGPVAWADHDQVYLWSDDGSITGPTNLLAGSFVFVKNLGGNVVELYADSALANIIEFTSATGRFYLERRAANPGQFGNLAPPLLAQPNAKGNTLWEVGFMPVPVNLQVTNTDDTASTWTVPNHRLVAGDAVTLAQMPTGGTPPHAPPDGDYFAYPLNDHTLQLFDTQENAELAATGSVAGLIPIEYSGETAPVMKKSGASLLPMPPATEGYYAPGNRLVLVNGTTLMISDPLDPLHYTPQMATITANLGESDAITGVCSLPTADVLVIAKEKSILALYNFSQTTDQWTLRSVTHEYGCLSALTLKPWGNRLLFLSRRGLDCVQVTLYGVVLPAVIPLSYDLKKYVDQLDWGQANISAVETWNNRMFWSARLKTGDLTPGNNVVFSLNFLNSQITAIVRDPSETRDNVFAWEGAWTGALLKAAGWARHTISGEERLTFVMPNGQVYWLDEGVLDEGNVPITDSLRTRLYTGMAGGTPPNARKIWLTSLVNWDTHDALLTVTAATPGWQEMSVLTPDGGFAYNPLKYGAGEGPDYNPATQQPPFNAPFREDYTMQGPGELIGGQPDVRQNHSEPFRLREDDWAVQFIIANTRGGAWIKSLDTQGITGPSSQRSRV